MSNNQSAPDTWTYDLTLTLPCTGASPPGQYMATVVLLCFTAVFQIWSGSPENTGSLMKMFDKSLKNN